MKPCSAFPSSGMSSHLFTCQLSITHSDMILWNSGSVDSGTRYWTIISLRETACPYLRLRFESDMGKNCKITTNSCDHYNKVEAASVLLANPWSAYKELSDWLHVCCGTKKANLKKASKVYSACDVLTLISSFSFIKYSSFKITVK